MTSPTDSTTDSSPADPAGELSRERDRVVQRLRSTALDAIPAERVHTAAQQLADLAADAGGGPRRTVPVLAPYAAGDQVAVLAGELLEAGAPTAVDEATRVLRNLRLDLSAPRDP